MSGTRIAAFEDFNGRDEVQKKSKTMYESWIKRKNNWEYVAKSSTPVVDYMKKTFYNK